MTCRKFCGLRDETCRRGDRRLTRQGKTWVRPPAPDVARSSGPTARGLRPRLPRRALSPAHALAVCGRSPAAGGPGRGGAGRGVRGEACEARPCGCRRPRRQSARSRATLAEALHRLGPPPRPPVTRHPLPRPVGEEARRRCGPGAVPAAGMPTLRAPAGPDTRGADPTAAPTAARRPPRPRPGRSRAAPPVRAVARRPAPALRSWALGPRLPGPAPPLPDRPPLTREPPERSPAEPRRFTSGRRRRRA